MMQACSGAAIAEFIAYYLNRFTETEASLKS
jgi:hypothetical protein